jgi:signal transduction histidine kinase/ActR/RegA family two-component response regulator
MRELKTSQHRQVSSTTSAPSQGDLADELEREKQFHARAALDAERYARYAKAFDQLCAAVLGTNSLQGLLQKLIEILVEASRADVGVLRLRDGDRLKSRAAVGLEEEVAAGFSIAVANQFAGAGANEGDLLLVSSPPLDGVVISEALRSKGIRRHHCLKLLDGDELVGAALMGARDGQELSEDDRSFLRVLGSRAAAAVSQVVSREALLSGIAAREGILAVVAHDLKNPVHVISLTAGGILRRMPNAAARRPIERIIRAADRAERLLRDLSEVTAIESGRFSIEQRDVEPTDLILSALESQQGLAQDASVIIATDLSPELPPIEADEERLLEVLENLIGNAVKFTGSGGSITLGAALRENEILFWVKDNGSGIAPEELPHVFDRFWQAKKAQRRGTGLGLTISKGIVEAHRGRIWAESAPNHGTTMSFTIPCAAPTIKSEDIEIANILLVDDRPENLVALKAILERPNYRLISATSGDEALALALRERFSLALIDVAMPGMNGLEVAIHLKELARSRDIPIIFITAFGDDPEEIHRAYSAGGADYLVKPLDPEIVRKKVAVFVDLSRRRFGNPMSRSDKI